MKGTGNPKIPPEIPKTHIPKESPTEAWRVCVTANDKRAQQKKGERADLLFPVDNTIDLPSNYELGFQYAMSLKRNFLVYSFECTGDMIAWGRAFSHVEIRKI